MHAPEPQALFKLQGYGGTIQNVKEMSPCFADTPLEELKERYERDGVVWVSVASLYTVRTYLNADADRSKGCSTGTWSWDAERTTFHS